MKSAVLYVALARRSNSRDLLNLARLQPVLLYAARVAAAPGCFNQSTPTPKRRLLVSIPHQAGQGGMVFLPRPVGVIGVQHGQSE